MSTSTENAIIVISVSLLLFGPLAVWGIASEIRKWLRLRRLERAWRS